jgi:hypothetical protein
LRQAHEARCRPDAFDDANIIDIQKLRAPTARDFPARLSCVFPLKPFAFPARATAARSLTFALRPLFFRFRLTPA